MPTATMTSPLVGAVDVCMFCGKPSVRTADALPCYCGHQDLCPNCGTDPCACTPAPCCGAPWSPWDWKNRGQCYICGTHYKEVAELRLESVSLVANPLHPSWRVTKVDGRDV